MEVNQCYQLWLDKAAEDPALIEELKSVDGNEEEIFDRFYRELSFGTAGLRGILGAGTNRMNIYTIRRATQGLANHLCKKKAAPAVAVCFDSRINSHVFAKETACVLAANGIQVHLFPQLMPVPCLSFATRELHCDAGIMVTASHNPAKYNGYKVYGSDGCQLTEADADAVLSQINSLDYFENLKVTDFDRALEDGTIQYISDELIASFMDAVKAQQQNPGICREAALKLVYSPLNGAGNIPVRQVLAEIGVTDITVVPEQEQPDGNFPTCPYPNPEMKEALQLGLELSAKTNADLMLATDPDCDRVGIAVHHKKEYSLLTGNQVGVLLLDYICKSKTNAGSMPQKPFAVTTIVSTKMAGAVGKSYGVEIKNVLTGFKYIGEQIALAEHAHELDRFLFGFEESYGYLSGTHARDKDAVVASMLIAEMAAFYKKQGKTLIDVLEELYLQHGYYLEDVMSFTFEGAAGMKQMNDLMESLRRRPPVAFDGATVAIASDYKTGKRITAAGTVSKLTLPQSNVLEYALDNQCTVIVRPSGTEPKIKIYLSAVGKDPSEAADRSRRLAEDVKETLKLS